MSSPATPGSANAVAGSGPDVLRVRDADVPALAGLLGRYGLELALLPSAARIPGTYWGEPEAGVRGHRVFVRPDTPVHSLLHETGHVVCMDEARRRGLDTDAGGDDLEEAAVCYLQVLLADELDGVGRTRLMHDMDAWGYSFRLGSAAHWFSRDAGDALAWLEMQGLVTPEGQVAWRLRT